MTQDGMTHDDITHLVGVERPVFKGDWAKASGYERQAHMTLIAAWKKANGQAVRAVDPEPQTRMDTGEVERVSDETAALATLQAVIDDPKALHSDRIRAVEAQQRILQRVAAEQAEEKHGALVALRQALDALPPGERVPALQGLLRLTPSPSQQLVGHEPVSG